MFRTGLVITVITIYVISSTYGQVRYCFSCRSRGKLGDCRDPFLYNSTHLVPGVESVPCASGWCSKTIEGDEYGEDHDLATERRCLQRIPPDNNPRCSEALYHHKKIFICFCQGSYCNSAIRHSSSSFYFGILAVGLMRITTRVLYRL